MYVYSTVTASIAYTVGDKTIVIKGGANVTDKHMWTPRGVATEVTKRRIRRVTQDSKFFEP